MKRVKKQEDVDLEQEKAELHAKKKVVLAKQEKEALFRSKLPKALLRPKFTELDIYRVRYLTLVGIHIKYLKKKDGLFKAWVQGYQHLYAKAHTPLSAFRRVFKLLRHEGIKFP